MWIHIYYDYLIPPGSAVKLPSVDRSAVRKTLGTTELDSTCLLTKMYYYSLFSAKFLTFKTYSTFNFVVTLFQYCIFQVIRTGSFVQCGCCVLKSPTLQRVNYFASETRSIHAMGIGF